MTQEPPERWYSEQAMEAVAKERDALEAEIDRHKKVRREVAERVQNAARSIPVPFNDRAAKAVMRATSELEECAAKLLEGLDP